MGINKRANTPLIAIGLVLFALALLFQQCSDVMLSKAVSSKSVVETRSWSTLPPPEQLAPRLRVVIFVDQSYSMVQGKCDTDLDGKNSRPDQFADNCVPAPGIDPEMHRFSAVEEWLDELEAMPVVDEDDILVSLVPFSGGAYARPRDDEDTSLYRFRSIASARSRLEELRFEQSEEMKGMITTFPIQGSPPEATYMGTTAPRSTLDYMLPVLRAEMKTLETDGVLEATPFRVIYMSDGVFKPLKEHWEKVWKFSNCDQNPTLRLCYDLRRDFREKIGDVEANTFENTAASFRKMLALGDEFAESNLTLKFVKMHADLIPKDDLNQEAEKPYYRNLYDEIKKTLADKFEVHIYSQNDEHKPFSLLGSPTIKSYKIETFYVMNFNRHVNDFGEIVIDSDGDGLGDAAEVALKLSPTNPRSNGVCLDLITHLYGCKILGCNPELDKDGDGLNSCEEITLSTDDENTDSDGDGVLDAHEILRKLSASIDDRGTYSMGDSFTDHGHFLRGVSIFADLRSIASQFLINFTINEHQFVPTKNNLGQDVFVSEYEIDVQQIPIGNTLAVSYQPKLYREQQRPVDVSLYPLGISHEARENQILYMIKARAIQDPTDTYWLMLRENVSWINSNSHQKLPVDFRDFKQMK